MNGDLYIDPVFSDKQVRIWTGDEMGSKIGWSVDFMYGQVGCNNPLTLSVSVMGRDISINHYVRPVRSVR